MSHVARALLLLLLVWGCDTNGELEIDEASLTGCRVPDQGSCAVCCQPNGDCSWYTGDFGGSTDPWYNASGSACPSTCTQPCASCSERDEETLRETNGRCDCQSIRISNDPCFNADTCECTCSRYLNARMKCPAPG